MKKSFAILLIALMVFSSCGRRVYLNESNKIAVSQKKKRSPRARNGSNFWIALAIVVPNIIFFGSTISDQTGR